MSSEPGKLASCWHRIAPAGSHINNGLQVPRLMFTSSSSQIVNVSKVIISVKRAMGE